MGQRVYIPARARVTYVRRSNRRDHAGFLGCNPMARSPPSLFLYLSLACLLTPFRRPISLFTRWPCSARVHAASTAAAVAAAAAAQAGRQADVKFSAPRPSIRRVSSPRNMRAYLPFPAAVVNIAVPIAPMRLDGFHRFRDSPGNSDFPFTTDSSGLPALSLSLFFSHEPCIILRLAGRTASLFFQ